jgi:seryl-tRNA synthetase
MLDPKDIRSNPDGLRRAVRARRVDPEKADVDRWLHLDEQRRRLVARVGTLNADKNSLALLGKTDPVAAREKGKSLRVDIRQVEEELAVVSEEWQSIMDWFPNWPHPDMPMGAGAEDNVEERAWVPGRGYLSAELLGRGDASVKSMPEFPPHASETAFVPIPHWELGAALGGMDTLQAAKVSGSRFAYILGEVALMQWGITRLLIDRLIALGLKPIVPPLLIRERSLYGTSHFPEGRDQVYQIMSDNVEESTALFLVGSSEPANFSFFMDRTLNEADLPIRVYASTPCFRSEAGSWGRDTKGVKRVHQFDKIEMNAVCTPEQSEQIYEDFRDVNEWLLQTLELPYRVIEKCSGDAGYLATHRQRDLEAWLPGSREFMEVMTDTNTTDYQARRLGIRYKTREGKTRFCHTVNDTGCAMGRMLIAILENYQQKGGSVKVPRALQEIVQADILHPNR